MSIQGLYDYFYRKKRKEKLDYILEPLQAMTQLAFLSYCPKGSKININDNILTIQQPGVTQGLIRYFNDDTKEDLYYLMNVFRRFFDYYKFMLDDKNLSELYNLLIRLSILGIENLTATYVNSDKVNVLHTLQMYKIVLNNPNFFNNNKIYADDINIDKIFNKITNIYSNEEYYIIYNIFIQMENNPKNYINYIDGLNIIITPTNKKIKQWIDKNIAL